MSFNNRRYLFGILLALLLATAISPTASATSATEWNEKGNALYDQGDYAGAIECYDTAIALDPAFADPWNGKGNALYDQGNYASAIQCYDKAIAIDPTFVHPWSNKGNALYVQGNYAAAIGCYDKAIALDPAFANPWNGKGNALYVQGNYAGAIECYNSAIALDPAFADPWNGKGNVLNDQGKYAEAIECYDRAIALKPAYAAAWYNKGLILYKQGSNAAAIECYDRVIAIAPTYKGVWNNKGDALYAMGRYAAALECYDRAIEIDPTDERARQNRARTVVALGGSRASTPSSTTVPTTIASSSPTGSSYAQARAYYVSGSTAWSNAWGASDFVLIRQYLTQAKTEFTSALTTANAVNDPANTANLALVRSVATAYIALADAALAMYDGTDAYSAGQTQMNAANYAAAATSFQTAADRSDASKTLFGQATTTLQSVSYAGTEYGDGTAYTAVIVPILNGKAAYVGDYATYARAWQHTALAFQATAAGDQATFRSKGTLAMNLFAGLRTNPTFGADATTNYNILVGMLGSSPTVTPTPTPSAGSGLSPGVEIEPGVYRFSAAEVEAIRSATPHEGASSTGMNEGVWKSTVDPMQILAQFPALHLRSGYVLRAYVHRDFMGGGAQVFVMPSDSPFPDPIPTIDYWGDTNGSSLPPGADTAFMRYIESDGSPQSYLEATVFRMQAAEFAEYWHSLWWGDMTVLDNRPSDWETYTGRSPEPAVWSPVVRISGAGAEVTLHTFSHTGPSTGVYRVTEVFDPGSYYGNRTVEGIAQVPVTIIY